MTTIGSKRFLCTVVTPERVVLERQARFVALPAHDGEIGFLAGRAPLVVKLDVGRLRVESDEGDEELYVDGGFAEMIDNKLTILTEEARRPEELEREKVLADRETAKGLPSVSDDAFAARQRALKRSRTQLKLVGE